MKIVNLKREWKKYIHPNMNIAIMEMELNVAIVFSENNSSLAKYFIVCMLKYYSLIELDNFFFLVLIALFAFLFHAQTPPSNVQYIESSSYLTKIYSNLFVILFVKTVISIKISNTLI